VNSTTITKVTDDNGCKNRNVALGNRQPEGTWCNETSYAQVRILSLRILIHICLLRDMMGPSDANCGGGAKK